MCGHLVLGLRYRLHQAWAVPVTLMKLIYSTLDSPGRRSQLAPALCNNCMTHACRCPALHYSFAYPRQSF